MTGCPSLRLSDAPLLGYDVGVDGVALSSSVPQRSVAVGDVVSGRVFRGGCEGGRRVM